MKKENVKTTLLAETPSTFETANDIILFISSVTSSSRYGTSNRKMFKTSPHSAEEVAPVLVKYVPVLHLLHALCPCPEYVPGLQTEQAADDVAPELRPKSLEAHLHSYAATRIRNVPIAL